MDLQERRFSGRPLQQLPALLTLLAVTAFFAGVSAQSPTAPSGSILAVVYSRTDLSVFGALAQKAGLLNELSKTRTNMTGFLPNNAAFDTFALSLDLGIVNGIALGDTLPVTALRRLLSFHIVPKLWPSTEQGIASTLLMNEYRGALDFSKLSFVTQSGVPRVLGTTEGSSAGYVAGATDIQPGPYVSVNVIDTVLTYWFSSVAEALNRTTSIGQFVSGLSRAGLLDKATRPTFQGATLFAPTDSAWEDASKLYGINLRQLGNYDHNTLEALKNQIALIGDANVTDPLDYFGTVTYRSDSTDPEATVTTIYGTARSSSSSTRKSTLVATFNGNSSSYVKAVGTTAELLYTLPIGGPVSKAQVYVIDKVLMPVYTTPWQFLSAQANFTKFMAVVEKLASSGRSSLLDKLQSFNVSGTLLAPSNEAIETFLRLNKASSVDSVLSLPVLEQTLKSHVLTGAFTYDSFTDGINLRTISNISLAVSKRGLTNVTFSAPKTSPAMIQGRIDVPIVIFGRLYIQTVDYLLAPLSSNNDGGGAAVSVVPSALLMLVSLLAAVKLMTPLHA